MWVNSIYIFHIRNLNGELLEYLFKIGIVYNIKQYN